MRGRATLVLEVIDCRRRRTHRQRRTGVEIRNSSQRSISPLSFSDEELERITDGDDTELGFRGSIGVPSREEFERLKRAVEWKYERMMLEERVDDPNATPNEEPAMDVVDDPDDGRPAPDVTVKVEYGASTGFGYYHDADQYGGWPDDAELTRGQAETAGATPCPSCFPDAR